MANGWTGNILRVNLTTGNITLEDSSKFKSFVGGMGFGYKIMYDEVPPGTKPFDEANKLVFATGPLTGSGAPCSSRVNITSLSTFTKGNLVVDAHMGGFFAAQMKFAGYDVIIIEGKAKSPVWLKIKDDKYCVRLPGDFFLPSQMGRVVCARQTRLEQRNRHSGSLRLCVDSSLDQQT